MRIQILLATLLALPSLALAHEGHGIDTTSYLHYFSGSHLWVIAGAIICAAVAVRYVLKHQQGKKQR